MASWEVIRSLMEYPTTRRDHTSCTAHKYSLPSAVGCSVMSVSHSLFGPGAVNSRWTRSSCTGGPGFFHLPRVRAWAEAISAWEQIFHTRRSDTAWPASASSSAMNRYPNPGSSAWIS